MHPALARRNEFDRDPPLQTILLSMSCTRWRDLHGSVNYFSLTCTYVCIYYTTSPAATHGARRRKPSYVATTSLSGLRNNPAHSPTLPSSVEDWLLRRWKLDPSTANMKMLVEATEAGRPNRPIRPKRPPVFFAERKKCAVMGQCLSAATAPVIRSIANMQHRVKRQAQRRDISAHSRVA